VRPEGLCSFVLLELPAPTKQVPGAAAKWTKILLSQDKGKKMSNYVLWESSQKPSQSYLAADVQSVSTSWCRAHFGALYQMMFSCGIFMPEVYCPVSFLGALSDERSGLSFVSLCL
jgi:hypothetical protein